jgi:membrane-bound ClpP family serine protease
VMFLRMLHENANTIGVIGVFLVLLAYLLLQLNRISAESLNYSLLNTIGSAFILISLYFYWNLASGIIEIAWLIISLYGLMKTIHRKFKRVS